MRIETKLKLSAWAPILMALFISLALLFSYKKMRDSLEEGKTTRKIMQSMNELNNFVQSYMMYQNDRPRLQFLMEHDSISKVIDTIRFHTKEEQLILESIRHNSGSMKDAFLKLAANYERSAATVNALLLKEAEERLAGRILIKSRDVLSDALRLESLIHNEITTTQKNISMLIFFLIITITLPLTTVLLRMIRSINTSLSALRKGTEVIAAGNLNHPIAITSEDEIGELSRAFNLMSERLKNTTTSRDELRKEMEERRRTEEALRSSEACYRSLFDSMSEGFAFHEIITDEDGTPSDYRFLEINPAFERLTGLKRPDLIGKRVLEVLPGIETHWIENYGRVALTGEPLHMEEYSSELRRWYEIFAYQTAHGQFAVVFSDITARKATEQRLEQENREIALVNRILRVFTETTGDELFDQVLAIVQEGLASRHGVFGYIAEPGLLICPSLSKMLDECEIAGKCIRYPPEKWKGLWARALREKCALYNNEPSRVPPGHPAIDNNLAAPVFFRGEVIGLLNLANKEGGYTETDRALLETMAGRIAPLLYAWIQKKLREDERAKTEAELRQSRKDLDRAQEVGQIGSWRLDVVRNVLTWSDENHRIFGVPKNTPMTYETFLEQVHPDDRQSVDSKWKASLLGEDYDLEHRIIVDGEVRWVREKAYLEFDEAGELLGGFGISQDITERKQAEHALSEREERIRVSLEEKEVLLKEIHHRVKNNMQVISSLVALQADELQDPAMRSVLLDVTDRVRSMALVHEKLYQSGDLARVDFAEYARSLLNYLWRAHGTRASGIRLAMDLAPVWLSVNEALPCGLILNELVSNALKHAFRGRTDGEVAVSLGDSPQRGVRLGVRDDGRGLPEWFDWRQARSLGLRLVQMLAGQLNADVEVSGRKGTEFIITFEESKT